MEHTPHSPHGESQGFYGLGIAPNLLTAIEKLGFKTPTPIQHQAIPIAVAGKDVVGIAQTGTGKTLAFGVPMLQQIAQTGGRGLIILPTRELAVQVDEMLHQIGRSFGLRTALLIGGASSERQRQALQRQPQIIIGTPGRINDHLAQGTLRLGDVRILVLDEADRMLDMGFAPQIRKILQTVPKQRQTMLFSATMPKEIMRLATSYMQLPIRVEIAPEGTAAETVEQELFVVTKDQKLRLLDKLLQQYGGPVLIFSRTKFGARKIARAIGTMGHPVADLHSNKSFSQRQAALAGFKSGKYRILVATDIASRGIDVAGIELVVNYDVPENPHDYIHRIGRTGRAGLTGRAITFASADQGQQVRDIQKLMRTWIPITQLPALPPPRSDNFPALSYKSVKPRRHPSYRR
ncbi:MAG: DEAD/DEAH box helicase [Patescibacteria group bacterium]